MSTVLDWNLWRTFFITLGLGATFVFLTALVVQRWIPSMIWRRTLWQIAFLSVGLIALAELSGTGRVAWSWVQLSDAAPADATTVVESKVIDEPDPRLLLPRETLPAMDTVKKPLPGRASAWWPSAVWLAGFGVVLGWMTMLRICFWIFVRRRVVRDESLLSRVDAIARRLGLLNRIRVTEARGLTGPIAFGVFRPSISLPAGFARQHSTEQQDVMLAHELAHLAAHDPLWHTLADIVMSLVWWHPLAWMARRELRAATEAAADEASLVVENGPAALAECLVELGNRLTRPRSLGWLGMEGSGFRSSLGKRVKRLVTLDDQSWNPPAHYRVWLVRMTAPLVLAVAVLATTVWAQPTARGPATLRDALQQSVLGIALTVAMTSPQQEAAAQTNHNVEEKSIIPETKTSGTNDRQKVLKRKLDSILLEEIAFDGEPLKLAVEKLSRMVKDRDPEGTGINFILVNQTSSQRTDTNSSASAANNTDIRESIIHLMPPVKGVTVREALQEMLRSASVPLSHQAEAYAVVISASPALHTRFFRIDLDTFERALVRAARTDRDQAISDAVKTSPLVDMPPSETRPGNPRRVTAGSSRSGMLVADTRRYFNKLAVDFSAPGRALVFNERTTSLMARATLQELDIIEQAIGALTTPPPQVTIEASVFEVTTEDAKALGLDWFLGNEFANLLTNASSQTTNFQATGILTEPQRRVFLQAMERRGLTNLLNTPKMTLLSGRQGQLKHVRVRYIVTDLDWSSTIKSSTNLPQAQPIAEPFELGPVLDVIPYVQPDRKTIELTAIPTVTEFEGYDLDNRDRRETATMPDGRKQIVVVPDQPLPIFRLRQIVVSATVKDGHTLVLAGGSDQFLVNLTNRAALFTGKKPTSKSDSKRLLIVITTTLIDPAGNRINPSE